MKQLEVTILGQSYLLGCPLGGEADLLEAVGYVDREMSAIRDAGKVKARERIAVLAALNLAYALAGKQTLQPAQTLVALPAAAGVSAADEASTSAHSSQIDALMQRLDQALGADGQLL
jgi:cell division protein ZapA